MVFVVCGEYSDCVFCVCLGVYLFDGIVDYGDYVVGECLGFVDFLWISV